MSDVYDLGPLGKFPAAAVIGVAVGIGLVILGIISIYCGRRRDSVNRNKKRTTVADPELNTSTGALPVANTAATVATNTATGGRSARPVQPLLQNVTPPSNLQNVHLTGLVGSNDTRRQSTVPAVRMTQQQKQLKRQTLIQLPDTVIQQTEYDQRQKRLSRMPAAASQEELLKRAEDEVPLAITKKNRQSKMFTGAQNPYRQSMMVAQSGSANPIPLQRMIYPGAVPSTAPVDLDHTPLALQRPFFSPTSETSSGAWTQSHEPGIDRMTRK